MHGPWSRALYTFQPSSAASYGTNDRNWRKTSLVEAVAVNPGGRVPVFLGETGLALREASHHLVKGNRAHWLQNAPLDERWARG